MKMTETMDEAEEVAKTHNPWFIESFPRRKKRPNLGVTFKN